MLTVKHLLSTCGLETPHDRIKLVRHSDHLGRSIRQIIADGCFETYQAEQDPTVRPFHNCDVILSFFGTERNLAEFHGAYRVRGSRAFRRSDFASVPDYLRIALREQKKERIWYDLEELREFAPLRGRLIAQWVSTRGWFQKKDLEVFELRPAGTRVVFPGFQDTLLTWRDLKDIFSSPQLHRDWKVALSASAGIYRIVDHASGKIYIGAAYGAEGIWGRWKVYAQSGHGGNKLLKPLDPERFEWSIVRTISGSMSEKEVIAIERIEMAKHGSRAIGLNM